MKKKLLALGMLLTFTAALAGCGEKKENGPVATETYVEENEIQVISHDTENIYFKIGTIEGEMTAGLERLMADAERGEAANQYRFYRYTDFSKFEFLLERNLLDIATISLEDAFTLYEKDPELLCVLAINSRQEDGSLGVTVATKKFVVGYPYALQVFMEEMKYSAKDAVCVTGEDMKTEIVAYLTGEETSEEELPGDAFYYPLPEPFAETEEDAAE